MSRVPFIALAMLLLPLLLVASPQHTSAEEEAKPRVTFRFVDEDVRKVVQTIASYAGANVILHSGVEGKVTLHVVDIPWDEALRAAVTAVGGAVIEEAEGIYRVAASPPAASPPADGGERASAARVLVQLHDVSDLVEVHTDLADQVRVLPVDDARMQANTVLVIRATEQGQRAVAALLSSLRRERERDEQVEALKAEVARLREEVERLRAEVDALKKKR